MNTKTPSPALERLQNAESLFFEAQERCEHPATPMNLIANECCRNLKQAREKRQAAQDAYNLEMKEHQR